MRPAACATSQTTKQSRDVLGWAPVQMQLLASRCRTAVQGHKHGRQAGMADMACQQQRGLQLDQLWACLAGAVCALVPEWRCGCGCGGWGGRGGSRLPGQELPFDAALSIIWEPITAVGQVTQLIDSQHVLVWLGIAVCAGVQGAASSLCPFMMAAVAAVIKLGWAAMALPEVVAVTRQCRAQ